MLAFKWEPLVKVTPQIVFNLSTDNKFLGSSPSYFIATSQSLHHFCSQKSAASVACRQPIEYFTPCIRLEWPCNATVAWIWSGRYFLETVNGDNDACWWDCLITFQLQSAVLCIEEKTQKLYFHWVCNDTAKHKLTVWKCLLLALVSYITGQIQPKHKGYQKTTSRGCSIQYNLQYDWGKALLNSHCQTRLILIHLQMQPHG